VAVLASTPLARGPLLTLAFEVLKPAVVEDAVRLSVLSHSAETSDGAKVQTSALGGVISIEGSAIPSCFFYMH
jgi:hypothetical protein